jgi:hypothetical protein
LRRDAVTNTTTVAIFTCNHFFTTDHSWISGISFPLSVTGTFSLLAHTASHCHCIP